MKRFMLGLIVVSLLLVLLPACGPTKEMTAEPTKETAIAEPTKEKAAAEPTKETAVAEPTQAANSAPSQVKLTKADDGKAVVVAKGGTLEIALEGNPTTGYTWEVGSGDAAIVKLEGEPAFKADSDATGAGGMMTLKFKAEAVGKTDLELVYHQSWEKDKEPAETFGVSVTVE